MTNIEKFLNHYESINTPEIGEDNAREYELALNKATSRMTPVFDLRNFVAVNPYFGFVDQDFPLVLSKVNIATGAQVLPQNLYYAKIFAERGIGLSELKQALDYAKSVNDDYVNISAQQVWDWVSSTQNQARPWINLTFSQAVNDQDDPATLRFVKDEISKWLAAYYDEGQAIWGMPWKNQKLFKAWCAAAKLDKNFLLAGYPDLSVMASRVETGAREFIYKVATTLELTPQQLEMYSYSLLEQLKGWSSFVKYKNWHAKDVRGDLEDLLAILMMVDINLSEKLSANRQEVLQELKVNWQQLLSASSLANNQNVRLGYVCQIAIEQNYRNKIALEIKQKATGGVTGLESRPKVQAVFCIDVRSEVIRRNLESLSPEVETLGFAGFFGLPLSYSELGRNSEVSHLPVLLKPKFQLKEVADDVFSTTELAFQKTQSVLDWTVVKKAKSSAISCFSFVESYGAKYAFKLIANSLGIHSRQDSPKEMARTSKMCPDTRSLALADKVSLAEGMLKNMGLTKNFAPLVLLLGHGSKTQNNPYASGLDCGACGGNTGEFSAKVAAQILNDQNVRLVLKQKGIDIPADTRFEAGLHNTTTDQIELYEKKRSTDKAGLARAWVESLFEQATRLASGERAERFGSGTKTSALNSAIQRSSDWSELRPEWALARNACFIAAPRSTTKNINLEGRSFLHNYDFRNDPELKVLELIMTAPMVVANWINMQYFASTVDSENMGSGNKTTQNVIGTFGVVQGNVGDLKIGLSEQSVRLGDNYVHEPMRLQVMIEAPRESIQKIIDKHDLVRNLVDNDWLNIVQIDPVSFESSLYRGPGDWR